ncbi:hypothetical protein fHeYen901_161 [Yersinia phage fHe-Yen9-01]|uniref:Trimeric autotransporter adhesin YadA-like C-terminal membrane anchor domain-containing protein n=1 Tax=Yersinia phage fHe-Yen9-01 TaxID=1965363 RepID=A0A1V0DXR3_9CAUD|nr:hypothetical protein KNT60_gp160 [Yersinia phage fHe-Yen9-01]ARB05934.1 hypothetical protein fHeYen901_161 [Yersinia phage fHe-Yen9-01]
MKMNKMIVGVVALCFASVSMGALPIKPPPFSDPDQVEFIESRFNVNQAKINSVQKQANAGVAGVAAMSSIPAVAGQTLSVGAAFGSFENESAVAVGITFAPLDRVAFKTSFASTTDGNVGSAGVAFGF